MKELKLLHFMCTQARVRPYTAQELSAIHNMPVATTYHALRKLEKAGLVSHVYNGYMLSQVILNAGALYQQNLARITIQTMEEIYAAKNSKTAKH
ncbi:MAG: hypothetical protein Kow00102_03200 [Spirochaetota bacterium]|nr:helix-turn-helix domain-containing protein [Spirochaetota bacterium]